MGSFVQYPFLSPCLFFFHAHACTRTPTRESPRPETWQPAGSHIAADFQSRKGGKEPRAAS